MQYRYTDLAIGVDVRVPHFTYECHYWWIIGVVVWELELRLEVATLVQRVLGALKYDVPAEQIVLIGETDGRAKVVILLHVSQLLAENVHCVHLIVGLHIDLLSCELVYGSLFALVSFQSIF